MGCCCYPWHIEAVAHSTDGESDIGRGWYRHDQREGGDTWVGKVACHARAG